MELTEEFSAFFPLEAHLPKHLQRFKGMNHNFSIQRSGSIDAASELFALPVEKIDIVLVDDQTIEEARSLISGCEHCAEEEAEISFDYVLDELTGFDPTRTEYLMSRSARCPRCLAEVTEKTLIIPD